MGTITTSIGLISGINYQQLINQLIQLESTPVNNQTALNKTYDQQRTAIAALEANLIALQSTTNKLSVATLYSQRNVASSNAAALSATVTGQAQIGQYQLTPVQLAQNQQLQSTKFASNSSAIGAGSFTLRNGGFVDPDSSLDLLNSGQGFARGQIKITDRSGATAIVDLRFARTVDDVLSVINNVGIGVQASTSGDQFVLTDSTGQSASNLKVEQVGTGSTAASLGLADINVAADEVSGSDVLKLFGDLSLGILNDGAGVRFNEFLPDLQISFRDGTTANVDLHILNSATKEQTLADVIETLNSAAPGKLQASISASGDRLQLTDLTTDTGGTFAVSALNSSQAARDLGLDTTASGDTISGRRLLGGLKSVLLNRLNGGAGPGTLGSITITTRHGDSADVDLSSAETLDDVIAAISQADIGVEASINNARNGIVLSDITGSTDSNFIIANTDATNTADKFNLAVNTAGTIKSSGNLKLQVVGENTLLSKLNGGGGVGTGSLRITDTNRDTATVTLGSAVKSIGDVLQAINAVGLAIDARVNDDGDGIVLIDTAHGSGTLTVTSSSGTVARDLHLLGGAQTVDIGGIPTQEINGSTTLSITLNATDTLQNLAQKINDAGFGVQAAIISDGSSIKPYQLTLFNNRNGKAGELLIDTSGVGFFFQDTLAAQDAKVVLGSLNSPSSVLATSSTNSLTTLLPGLSVNASNTSATPVLLTVGTTNTNLTSALQSVVDAYNKVHTQIAQLSKFDTTSNTAAILQGDSTILQVDTNVTNLLTGDFGSGSIRSLAQLGIIVGQDGTLQFNQDQFQAAYNADPTAVQNFLSTSSSGFSDRAKTLIDSLSGPTFSTLVQRVDTLSRKIDDGQNRIDFLNARLDILRQRLTAQFNNAELAIAKIQSNLSAINAIQPFLFLNGSGSSLSSNSGSSNRSSLSNVTG